MMLAVMYGMMPSAKTVSFSSDPPLNRLTSWKMLVLVVVCRQALTACWETPGVGSEEPSRNTAMMKTVNRIFLRRSGVRKARRNAVSMRSPLLGGSTSSAAPVADRWSRSRRRERESRAEV